MTRREWLGAAGGAALAGEGVLKSRDPRTGREVWQITSGPSDSHSCYFEAQPFTPDDRYLVYASRNSGAWQLHRVDLRSHEHRQLTRCARLSSMSYSMHPDGKHVVYLDGTRLCRTEVSTGAESEYLDLAREFPAPRFQAPVRFHAGRTFSPDGEYTAAGYSDAGGGHGVALVNLRQGKVEKTLATPQGTGGHTLICPADPYLATYARTPDRQNDMTLPMEERPRTMIVNFRTGEIRPYLTMPYGWRATHEYWGPRGDRFYWHKKKAPGWVPASICSMKRDGSDWQTHFTSETLMLGHSMISSDGRGIVSDVQKANDNPLLLIDVAKGSHQVLCWPDSTMKDGQLGHVHPTFSLSGRYVAYTSDRGGVAQVYVVPLG